MVYKNLLTYNFSAQLLSYKYFNFRNFKYLYDGKRNSSYIIFKNFKSLSVEFPSIYL